MANNFQGDLSNGTVSRVGASDGKLLDTWTGAFGARGVLCAMGKVFVTGSQGKLYQINPTQPAGAVVKLTSRIGGGAYSLAL